MTNKQTKWATISNQHEKQNGRDEERGAILWRARRVRRVRVRLTCIDFDDANSLQDLVHELDASIRVLDGCLS